MTSIGLPENYPITAIPMVKRATVSTYLSDGHPPQDTLVDPPSWPGGEQSKEYYQQERRAET
jgi:hypothetical protein